MRNKKSIILSFSIILSLIFFILIICYIKKDQLDFHHFMKTYLKDTLSENSLDLQYTLKNPEDYGIKTTNRLPTYKKNDALSFFKETQSLLKQLDSIDVSSLSTEDAFTYRVLHDYLEETLALENFPYYEEPLTPNSGIHTTLPILLTEYHFYDKQDVENYLELLSYVPDYLEGILIYDTEKAQIGLFMNSISLEKVVTALEEMAFYEDISAHLLCTGFKERLEELAQSDVALSSKEKEYFLKQNEQLVENHILPSYSSLASKLTELSPHCNNHYTGLQSLENGRDYYLALVTRNTGSDRNIAQIKEMLYADLEENYTNLLQLLSLNPQLLEEDSFLVLDTNFPLNNATKILNNLQSVTKTDFPALNTDTGINVKSVSSCLEDYCAPAFYLTVPMDWQKENVIYLNEKNALTGIDLYTTLAHEGFPGHLYQTVYFHQNNIAKKSSKNYTALLRNTLYYGGYTEGYALYAETLAYDYAALLCSQHDISDAKLLCDTLKYQWQMQISLYCLLDIAIHYDGASYEQIAAILNKFGIPDEANAKAIYQYLLEEPTTYLKYYLGYLEIQNLKGLAKILWNEEYSDLKFHTFLLETGPCNFMRLREKIMEE